MSHHCTDIALGGKSNSGYYDYHHFKTRKNQTLNWVFTIFVSLPSTTSRTASESFASVQSPIIPRV